MENICNFNNLFNKCVAKEEFDKNFNLILTTINTMNKVEKNLVVDWLYTKIEYPFVKNILNYIFEADLFNGTNELDFVKAFSYYENESKLNDPKVLYILALIYYRGYGVKQDIKKAIELFNRLSENVSSYNFLGMIYADGNTKFCDYKKAMTMYKKHADYGFSSSMKNIAYLYHDGKGVPRDLNIALEWYKKSHEHGNSHGHWNLAMIYKDMGNFIKALHHFILALSTYTNKKDIDDCKSHIEIILKQHTDDVLKLLTMLATENEEFKKEKPKINILEEGKCETHPPGGL